MLARALPVEFVAPLGRLEVYMVEASVDVPAPRRSGYCFHDGDTNVYPCPSRVSEIGHTMVVNGYNIEKKIEES